MNPLTERHARALESLADGVLALEDRAPRAEVELARERGYFRPLEEGRLVSWFARLLTLRDALWEVIAEIIDQAGSSSLPGAPSSWLERALETEDDWRSFLLGYAAACLLVRIDRLLVEDLATHDATQRKLNEGSIELRIPRKQFTAIFESLSQPRNALLMRSAMKVASRNRARISAMADDPLVGPVARRLESLEQSLDSSKSRYLELLLDFSDHALRRWGASTTQKTSFGVLESSGRLVAELRDRWRDKRVERETIDRIRELLRPGDVIATRHDVAMSNLFLPGYWPHTALYVGTTAQREELGIELDSETSAHWRDDRCILEALKDGVHFRRLEETLAVDAVAVIRPSLDPDSIARAIERVAPHRGKMYNFDFDFFRSDRLVCTEVVYRAFDGPLNIELRERAGRPTLSAEDLLDLAFDTNSFEVVALFGARSSEHELLTGERAKQALATTYRTERANSSDSGDRAEKDEGPKR